MKRAARAIDVQIADIRLVARDLLSQFIEAAAFDIDACCASIEKNGSERGLRAALSQRQAVLLFGRHVRQSGRLPDGGLPRAAPRLADGLKIDAIGQCGFE